MLLISLIMMISAVVLVTMHSSSTTCASSIATSALQATGLVQTPTILPPSHDNDAGKGRLPDLRPDADVDQNQRAQGCSRLNLQPSR